MKAPAWAFVVFKAVVVMVCLVLAAVAGLRGLADYYADQSYELVMAWRGNPALPDWQNAQGILAIALRLDPTNPTYHHRMGRLYHIGMGLEPERRAEWGDLAKTHLHTSIAVRPVWPLTWANLALLKVDLAQFDDEFAEAVLNAARYGPWEPGVHQMLSAIGAGRLLLLRADVRDAIIASNLRGLLSPVRGGPGTVLQVLERYSVLDQRYLLPPLASLLVTRAWEGERAETFARAALAFWTAWDEETRGLLVSKVVGAAGERGVLNQVREAGQLSLFCPELPEGPARQRFCRA